MDFIVVFKFALNIIGQKNTSHKSYNGKQVIQAITPVSHHKILTHKHHIARLGISKNPVSDIKSIGVL